MVDNGKIRRMINYHTQFLIFLFLLFIITGNSLSTSYVIPESNTRKNIWVKPNVTHFWQGCNTTFIISWDDARVSDVNLAPIDEKYGISHTIFSPSYRSYPNRSFWRYAFLLDELFQGYDVQSHCGEHVHLSNYNYNLKEQEYYIEWGKTGIEDLFGFTPIVFAYPYGDTGGSQYVKKYFDLGRTIGNSGISWPPTNWHLEGTSVSYQGINSNNLNQIVDIMRDIYQKPGFQVFKGYGHTNEFGTNYGVSNFEKYEKVISQIANWPDVWYTSWGELVAYEIEKKHLIFSEVIFDDTKLEFELSAPSFNTDIYKVPITLSIFIPNSWDNPTPQVRGKYTSRFSLKDFNDCRELFLDVIPQKESQRIIIWRSAPTIDRAPPQIKNFNIETRSIFQNWKVENPTIQNYTFMRFDVIDELSNVYQVNASVHLKTGDKYVFSNIENPIFWQNSTFGRVVWDSTVNNADIRQIQKEEIKYTFITVQDSFGNTRHNTIYSCGCCKESIVYGSQNLKRFPDKQASSEKKIPKLE